MTNIYYLQGYVSCIKDVPTKEQWEEIKKIIDDLVPIPYQLPSVKHWEPYKPIYGDGATCQLN